MSEIPVISYMISNGDSSENFNYVAAGVDFYDHVALLNIALKDTMDRMFESGKE